MWEASNPTLPVMGVSTSITRHTPALVALVASLTPHGVIPPP
jgi:hypothetical protein